MNELINDMFQADLYKEFGQSSAGVFVEHSLTTMTEDSPQQTGVNEHIFQVSGS